MKLVGKYNNASTLKNSLEASGKPLIHTAYCTFHPRHVWRHASAQNVADNCPLRLFCDSHLYFGCETTSHPSTAEWINVVQSHSGVLLRNKNKLFLHAPTVRAPQLEKPAHCNKDPAQPKINSPSIKHQCN